MRRLISILLAGLAICCAEPARAQSTYQVVAACGTVPSTPAVGAVRVGYMDQTGKLCTAASVVGGGDASAANQVLQIAQETAFNTALGLIADAACATDNGTCDVIALLKRGNQRLTTINTTLGTPMQATGGTVGLVAGVAEIGNIKNSGTFAVQATLTAETTKVIGTVNQGTSPWVTSGAVTVSSATAPVSTMNSSTANAGTTAAVAGVFDDASPTAITENSFGYMRMSANRNIYSTLRDAAGNERGANISAANELQVGSGTLGTAANQSAIQAPVAPATATATKSVLLGAQATTAAVNPTTGQQAALSSDTNNNLLVSAGGAPNLTIAQVSIATSDTLAIAARALRRAVTIQQITGTQNVFCNQTTATAANGVVLPAVVGASITFNTTSAIRCIAITGAQTVAVAETY